MGILKLYFKNNAYNQRKYYKGLCSVLRLQAKMETKEIGIMNFAQKWGGGGI